MKKTIKIDLNLLIKAKFQENQNTFKSDTTRILINIQVRIIPLKGNQKRKTD